MALKTHIGGAESDSFITLPQAASHLAVMVDDITEWESLSDFEQEFRLQMAAQLMGHLPLRGRKVFRNQALCFPRTSQPYESRFAIPEEAIRAQAFIAYSVVHRMLKERPLFGEGNERDWGSPKDIRLAGLVEVSFQARDARGDILESLVRSLAFPAYMMLKKWMSQIRGGAVASESSTLSTTTTTTTSTTTA